MSFLPSRAKKVATMIGLSATLLLFPWAASAAASGRDHDLDYGHRGLSMDRDHDFVGHRGFYYYPGYDWGWGWGLGWGGPWYYPGYYYVNPTGTIKLENVTKTDQIYINGAYLGEAKDFKSIHLNPGPYTLTVKHKGNDVINQQVYVVRNKTVTLNVRDKDGTIKLKDAAKADKVYVNGLYKGEVRDVESMHMPPGWYQIMITDNGRNVFDRNVYLPTNKTLDLRIGDKG
jgi:hypothetical protein